MKIAIIGCGYVADHYLKTLKDHPILELTGVTDLKRDRAEEIARILNNPERWHSHGYGISMEELRRDLKLLIDDFESVPQVDDCLSRYHGLLVDYMIKNGDVGVLHAPGQYVPFHVHAIVG